MMPKGEINDGGTGVNEQRQQQIEDIAKHLVREKSKGKQPLLIVGSGISQVPSIKEIMSHIKKTAESRSEYSAYIARGESNGFVPPDDLQALQNLAARVTLAMKGYDRDLVASVFRMLGEASSDSIMGKVWTEVCDYLLEGVMKAQPGPAHQYLAELYNEVGGLFISLNFDGLERRVLRENSVVAIAYHDPMSVQRFMTRRGHDRVACVLKMGGDALFCACTKDCCTEFNKMVPVADLLRQSKKGYEADRAESERRIERLKTCPVCNSTRKIIFVFPGSYEKEKNAAMMLQYVNSYFMSRCSCIVIVATSGRWDRELVEFVRNTCVTKSLPILVICKEELTPYNEIVKVHEQSKVPLSFGMAHEAADVLRNLVEAVRQSVYVKPKIARKEATAARDVDGLWDQVVPFDYRQYPLLGKVIDATKAQLDRWHQTGLKSFWWAEKRENLDWVHKRSGHCYGVGRVAYYLYENVGNIQKDENEEAFLLMAALVHDIGHLPFGHLLESVFNELNWNLGTEQEPFSHEAWTACSIPDMLQEALNGENLEGVIGYSPEDLRSLIRGSFGIPYLDVFINSECDADKVDYVFRDIKFGGVGSGPRFMQANPSEEWLKRFTQGLWVSKEGHVVAERGALDAIEQLLETRAFLYDRHYLDPHLQLLDRIARWVISNWLVRKVTPLTFKERPSSNNITYDLGITKIAIAVNEIERLRKEVISKQSVVDSEIPPEAKLLRSMVASLKEAGRLSSRVKAALRCIDEFLEKCERAKDMQERRNVALREARDRCGKIGECYLEEGKTEEVAKRLHKIARDVTLTYPGSFIADISVRPPFFSFAGLKYHGGPSGNQPQRIGILARTRQGSFLPLHQALERKVRVPGIVVTTGRLCKEKTEFDLAQELFIDLCGKNGISMEWR
jgi:HD superfamily phosphohydrolase